jgi:hypothetical protein
MVKLVVNQAGFPTLANLIFMQVGRTSWVMGRPMPFTPELRTFPIKAHGDEQSDSCLGAVTNQTVVCADMFLDFAYYLPDQPGVQDRRQRLVFTRDRYGELGWQGQPLESKEDYCYPYLSDEGRSVRDKSIRVGVADFSRKEFVTSARP